MRCGAMKQVKVLIITNLIQDAENHVWHTLHVLREHPLKQRCDIAHYSLRVHAFDSWQHFRQNLSTKVLHKRGRH
jgi:hypothetical protein